jgi:hypothetical protein
MDFLDVRQKFNSVNTLSYLFTNVAVDTGVRVMVLNALSTYFSYIVAVSFYVCNFIGKARLLRQQSGLGLWCLMPLSTIVQLNRGSQFYWRGKPEYPEKATDLSQVTYKLHHIIMWDEVHLVMIGIRTRNLSGNMH